MSKKTDITDVGAPLAAKATDALINAGIGAFVPVMFMGVDCVALMIGDVGEVKDLPGTVRKVLMRAGFRGLHVEKTNESSEISVYLATFPIAANTVHVEQG